MGNFGEQHCALCHNATSNANYKKMENITKEILEVILLKVKLDDKQIMCEMCSLKVMEAFNFKSMCLYTDDTLIPYFRNKTGRFVDLKDIYAKENGIEQLTDLLDESKVCRLCMQLIRSEFISVRDIDADMVESYIPEINFNIVEDPFICRQCFDSFDTHSSFVKRHLEIEKKIKLPLSSCIKTEDIEIKSEASVQQEELCKTGSTVVKCENVKVLIKTEFIEMETEENDENDMSNHEGIYKTKETKCISERHTSNQKKVIKAVHRCQKCNYKTIYKKHFACHQLEHEDPSIIKKHKCNICNYKAKRRTTLLNHQLTQHKSPSEINMFKCIYCKYESKVKQGLRTHFISHHGENLMDPEENSKVTKLLNLKNPLPVKVHKCDKCSYKTLSETNFLIHQSKSHEKMFLKCDECDYRTMSNFCFETHKLTHKDPSEVETYKCNNCNYKSKYKRHIIRHQLIHLSPEQVQMHKCIYCSYESKHKEALKSHMVVHHRDLMLDPVENLKVTRMLNLQKPLPINVYTCDECTYETIYKLSFLDHQLTHRNRSEVQMYKCDTCDWETKYKRRLTKHKLEHKRSHEVRSYECDICGFAAKVRSSLHRHQLKHKNTTEVQIFKCNNCNYETKFKGSMVQHQLLHKSPSRISMYKCDICDFETRHRNSIRKHNLMHKNPSEVPMYNCDICDYAAKQKNNLNRHKLKHKNDSQV